MPDNVPRNDLGPGALEPMRTEVEARGGLIFLTERPPLSMTIGDALAFAKLLIEGTSAAVKQLEPAGREPGTVWV